jgi:hypothetical protein
MQPNAAMSYFLVRYHFVCPECGHRNMPKDMTVYAKDGFHARELAFREVKCSGCHKSPGSQAVLSMKVRMTDALLASKTS